jgi:hypothetical protein
MFTMQSTARAAFAALVLSTSMLVGLNHVHAVDIDQPHPQGFVNNPVQSFQWSHQVGATHYQLSIRDGSDVLFTKWYTAEELDCLNHWECSGCHDHGQCSIARTLAKGEGRWWYRSWSAEKSLGPWSEQFNFNVNIAQPELSTPSGEVADPKQNFYWVEEETASWYRLIVTDSSGIVYTKWHDAINACHDGICHVDLTSLILAPGTGTWTVQGWNAEIGHGLISKAMTFNVAKIGQPETFEPRGVVETVVPSFIWDEVPGATSYEIVVADLSKNVSDPDRIILSKWYIVDVSPELSCGKGCELEPELTLPIGPYIWWVRPWNPIHKTGKWSENTIFFTLDMDF